MSQNFTKCHKMTRKLLEITGKLPKITAKLPKITDKLPVNYRKLPDITENNRYLLIFRNLIPTSSWNWT